ncbi:MATE family efflux transporter [Fusobacterium mortiferum]|uniref:Multidrug export protein MepA n=2 Tax=Fusobacterium TaxID=848 RepID=A0ABS2G167_FUSMR|nr:MATE family efflux transporter [Fusobacterium mortiferum]MBM6874822.1 MATE family efflux transporter [Fusobacterium mortiferum]MBU3841629.1 MATE family efflux transporter [Candidatus Fusobacterium pullicola]
MEKKHQLMGTEKITKLLVQFSLPAIIGMLVNALYNIVDRIYIGNIENVGHIAIAGVGITFPVVIFVFGFSILIGLGAATNASLNLGKKKKEEAEKFLGVAVSFGFIVSLILMVLVLWKLEWLVNILGGSDKTGIYAAQYLKILAYGFPAAVVGYVANASIRSDGNPKMAMATLLIGAITNIALDPIFIFYLKMGVKGAAWATIISQYVSGIWAIYYFTSKFSGMKLYLKNLKLDFGKIKSISSLGSAPFAIQIGASVVNYTYNSTLKIYGGDTAIGAMAIVQAVITFISMPIFGINQGLQPILGYNYGAKLYSRVKEALFKAIFAATVLCVIDFLAIQFLSKYFINIFTHEKELVRIASIGLRIQTFMLPIVGFQIIASIYFQAIGKPKMSFFMSLTRQIIVLIPCILIMSKLFGVEGVWFAGPTADFIATVVTFIFIKMELKHLKELEIKVQHKIEE